MNYVPKIGPHFGKGLKTKDHLAERKECEHSKKGFDSTADQAASRIPP